MSPEMVPPSSIARLREAAELVGRLHARMESVYDGATQGAEWQPDAICQEAASTILALLAERQAMEEALAAVKVEMSELKRSNVILGEMLGEKTKTLVAAEADRARLRTALTGARKQLLFGAGSSAVSHKPVRVIVTPVVPIRSKPDAS